MEAVQHLNHLLIAFDECEIQSFDGFKLVIRGDFDLSYHHNFEAEFIGVNYLQCPVRFNGQAFRLASASERQLLALDNYVDDADFVFCFESDGRCFYIAAQSLNIREGLVLHYASQ